MSETPGSDPVEPDHVWRNPVLLISAACLWLLTLVGVGYTAWGVIQVRDYTNCQRGYNEDVTQTLAERASAGELDRMALREISASGVALIGVLLKPESSQDDRVRAIQIWRDAQQHASEQLTQADQTRADHPLPAPRVC